MRRVTTASLAWPLFVADYIIRDPEGYRATTRGANARLREQRAEQGTKEVAHGETNEVQR